MKEGLVEQVDRYLRRSDTPLARGIQAISPETGSAYRNSRRKSVIEKAITLPAAIISAPLVGVLATAVKLEDGGSSFYQSERIGQNGVVFDLIKIRSLHENADQDAEANMAVVYNAGNPDDHRSTRIGAWMRRRRFDELPQLWQVLSGKIALFGMRAVGELTLQAMQKNRPKDARRILGDYVVAKPAVINPVTAFNHGNGSINERYHYNAFYARRASLGVDLYMGFRTLVRLLKKTES
ncbi:MAG: sugar transferase [Candidatus Levybacteria bacterium]|nr:sugar transferase [Candidatus Levybacteria bacterium]